jgi:hypothetical protein
MQNRDGDELSTRLPEGYGYTPSVVDGNELRMKRYVALAGFFETSSARSFIVHTGFTKIMNHKIVYKVWEGVTPYHGLTWVPIHTRAS